MNEIEILKELRTLMCHFDSWNEQSYQALLKLTDKDIDTITPNYYCATFFLEQIMQCTQIKESMVPEEYEHLSKLAKTNPLYQKYIQHILKILHLSGTYTDCLKEKKLNHIVYAGYQYKLHMYTTESDFFEALEEYRLLANKELSELIEQFTDSVDLYTTREVENTFSSLVLSKVCFALQQNNVEKALYALFEYTNTVLLRNGGAFPPISLLASMVMGNLYSEQQYCDDPMLQKYYYSAERYYLQNKTFYFYYQNTMKAINKCKQLACKKM